MLRILLELQGGFFYEGEDWEFILEMEALARG